ncbi:hypothetical protein G3T36_08790 [Diaminobutyricibacter tongyongensis]|uniref:LPXTG cell wall anchor domain-containing protein n=1 Tax=Leifsonia tongyongensis TaxID=1268043 RepID=A0A6L9XX09_9MICO|nr:hypothetical protein [Diaminobutyricibacter tongyongensis]NEN05970.1 hypothetical protein [Diaminobutyricibacter tongyongensis]
MPITSSPSTATTVVGGLAHTGLHIGQAASIAALLALAGGFMLAAGTVWRRRRRIRRSDITR